MNAMLVAWSEHPDAPGAAALEIRWGRSYVEHLARLAAGDRGPLGVEAVALAAAILAPAMSAPPLVTLGARAHADVTTLLEITTRFVGQCVATLVEPSAV